MANDSPIGPQKPYRPPGETRKTEKGPHGGGNQYIQTTLNNNFNVLPPIKGHTMKRNIKNS